MDATTLKAKCLSCKQQRKRKLRYNIFVLLVSLHNVNDIDKLHAKLLKSSQTTHQLLKIFSWFLSVSKLIFKIRLALKIMSYNLKTSILHTFLNNVFLVLLYPIQCTRTYYL